MIKIIAENWNTGKKYLKNALLKMNPANLTYKTLVEEVVENIINRGSNCECNYNVNNISCIDDGDYQGYLLFVIPRDTYQPNNEEYLMTYVGYGSCNVCDALLSAVGYSDEGWTETKINDVMNICLSICQHMICPWHSFIDGMQEVDFELNL